MEIIRSAFERSSGDSQQIGNEQIPTLNTPVGVFVSLRARLIKRYFNLTLLTVVICVYMTARLVIPTLYDRFINRLSEAGLVAGHLPWQQSIPVAELAHERGRANARNVPTNKVKVDVRHRVERSIGWALA